MMSTNMAERPAAADKRRNALRNSLLQTIPITIAIVTAATLLNQSVPGQPPVYSPVSAVLLLVLGIIAVVPTVLYIKRTDEHDLLANLWGLTLAWLFMAFAGPAWWVFNRAGLIGPVDFWTLFFSSALVATLAWGWLRFR